MDDRIDEYVGVDGQMDEQMMDGWMDGYKVRLIDGIATILCSFLPISQLVMYICQTLVNDSQ